MLFAVRLSELFIPTEQWPVKGLLWVGMYPAGTSGEILDISVSNVWKKCANILGSWLCSWRVFVFTWSNQNSSIRSPFYKYCHMCNDEHKACPDSAVTGLGCSMECWIWIFRSSFLVSTLFARWYCSTWAALNHRTVSCFLKLYRQKEGSLCLMVT